MATVFLFCAVLGGTVFAIQLILSLVGMGHDGIDVGDDVPDGDFHDIPHDFSDVAGTSADIHDHGSTRLFGVLSVRTIVAALTFFGLTGLAMLQSSGGNATMSLVVALAAGVGALYGVHYILRSLMRLRQDGTVRIERSVGERATVYIPIPADHHGVGKVQIRVQGRLMEYPAQTAEPEALPTGTNVEVVGLASPTTLEVAAVRETANTRAPSTT